MLINFNHVNIYNNKTAQNSGHNPYTLKLNTINRDIFNKSLSFGNHNTLTEPNAETMKYISDRKHELKLQGKSPSSFKDYDLNKIKDILKGLTVFKNFEIFDLRIASNYFESILLQQGCKHGCSHCSADAKKNIKTMKWDNFAKLSEDIGTLYERIGFNPFEFRDTDRISVEEILNREVYPYIDSDPMYYKSKGKDGQVHNIFDAAMLYYKKTKGTKFIINTNGWSKSNLNSQKAADSFTVHPECISSFGVSVHPFDPLLIKSRDCIKKSKTETDPVKSKNYKEIGDRLRKKYIENMANTLKTSLKLPIDVEHGIVLLYAPKNAVNCDGCSEKDSINLLKEILNSLKAENIDTSYFDFDETFHDLSPFHINKREIQPVGRAEQFFNKEDIRYYKARQDNLRLEKDQKLSDGEAFHLQKFIDPDGIIKVNNAGPGKNYCDFREIEDLPKLEFDLPAIKKNLISQIKKIK